VEYLLTFFLVCGMQKSMKPKIAISIRADILERVDKLAKKVGVSRSQMVENLLSVALEDAELFEKFRILSIVAQVRKIAEDLGIFEKVKESEVKEGAS